MAQLHDRRFIFKEGHIPSAEEDECRYCKWGFLFKGFKDEPKEPRWACGRTSGNFRNLGNDYSCGYFERIEPKVWKPRDGEIIFRNGFYKITADNGGNWCGDFIASEADHREFKKYLILDDNHKVIGKVDEDAN